jgi:hypothetical protein
MVGLRGFRKAGAGRGAAALVRRSKRSLRGEQSADAPEPDDNGSVIAKGRVGIYSCRGEIPFPESAFGAAAPDARRRQSLRRAERNGLRRRDAHEGGDQLRPGMFGDAGETMTALEPKRPAPSESAGRPPLLQTMRIAEPIGPPSTSASLRRERTPMRTVSLAQRSRPISRQSKRDCGVFAP